MENTTQIIAALWTYHFDMPDKTKSIGYGMTYYQLLHAARECGIIDRAAYEAHRDNYLEYLTTEHSEG